MNNCLYIFGDADRVRLAIERLLFAAQLVELSQFSASLTVAIASLAAEVERRMGAEIIMAGGDDLLFRVPKDLYSHTIIQELGSAFANATGCTISFGVSDELNISYLNLRRAKSMGGGCVCEAQR